MPDVAAFSPSPPAPSPLAAADVTADALLAPWPLSPWPAPLRRGGDDGRSNPLFAILPLSALAIGLVLLVAVALILVLTRRAKLRLVAAGDSVDGDKPGAPASSCGSRVRGYQNGRCYAATGCIYGGRLGPLGPPSIIGAAASDIGIRWTNCSVYLP